MAEEEYPAPDRARMTVDDWNLLMAGRAKGLGELTWDRPRSAVELDGMPEGDPLSTDLPRGFVGYEWWTLGFTTGLAKYLGRNFMEEQELEVEGLKITQTFRSVIRHLSWEGRPEMSNTPRAYIECDHVAAGLGSRQGVWEYGEAVHGSLSAWTPIAVKTQDKDGNPVHRLATLTMVATGRWQFPKLTPKDWPAFQRYDTDSPLTTPFRPRRRGHQTERHGDALILWQLFGCLEDPFRVRIMRNVGLTNSVTANWWEAVCTWADYLEDQGECGPNRVVGGLANCLLAQDASLLHVKASQTAHSVVMLRLPFGDSDTAASIIDARIGQTPTPDPATTG